MFNIFDNQTALDDFDFILSQRGENIQINKEENIKALITNTNLEQVYDDRKITTLHNIQRGDIITYNNKIYMVISEVTAKRYTKYKAIMRYLPHKITLNQNCSFTELDCYITNSNLKVDAGTVMSLVSGNIQVHISKQQIKSAIPLTSRFFVGNQIFKVEGIDDFTREGIITLSCKSDLIDLVKDDVTNLIADVGTCKINITNTTIQLEEGETHQINYTTANNDVIVFTSSNNDVVTVSDTGLVTAIAEGQATVTLYNATMPNLQAEIIVNVNRVEVNEDITIEITSDSALNEIISGQSKVYQAIVKRGNEVLNEAVTWQLFADDQVSTTKAATITSQNDASCTVKNNNNTKDYVQLKATLVSDGSVFTWLRVRMKGYL